MAILVGFSIVGALLSAPHVPQRTRSPCASTSAEETAALKAVEGITRSLTRFGLDDGDRLQVDSLTAAVFTLYDTMPTEPPIADDPRLVGEWMLVGATSLSLISRKGLTGMGAAPFTNLATLHVSCTADGKVTAKEVLESFGKPSILNELRGTVSFTDDGDAMTESYDNADIGGQANSPAFGKVGVTLLESAITSCGQYRLGRDDEMGVYVFRKMKDGIFAEYLAEKRLPTSGGTYIGNPTWAGPGK